MARPVAVLAIMIAAASCDGRCGARQPSAPAAPAAPAAPIAPTGPAAAAVPAPTALTIQGLDQITDPAIAAAFRAWAERRAAQTRDAGGRAGYRIISVEQQRYLNVAGGEARLTVRARAEADDCTDEILAVTLDNDTRAPPVKVEEHSVGIDCCDDRPCKDRPAIGYMFDYTRALAAKDAGALARLVEPVDGVEIVIRMVGEGEDSEDTHRYRPAQAKEALRQLSTISTITTLTCGAFEAGGEASCSAYGGGWEAHYIWRRTERGVFLVSVREKSH